MCCIILRTVENYLRTVVVYYASVVVILHCCGGYSLLWCIILRIVVVYYASVVVTLHYCGVLSGVVVLCTSAVDDHAFCGGLRAYGRKLCCSVCVRLDGVFRWQF